MHILAGLFVLLAFLADVRSESCAETQTCMRHATNIQSASSSGDVKAICKMQSDLTKCIESALADCRATGTAIPEASVQTLTKVVADIRKQFAPVCKGYEGGSGTDTSGNGNGMTGSGSSGGTIPEVATCLDMTKCVFDIQAVNDAVENNRLQEACDIVRPSTKCMKSAYADCKKNKILPQDQLDNLNQQVNEAEQILNQRCGSGNGGSSGGSNGGSSGGGDGGSGAKGLHHITVSLVIFTAFSVIAARLF